MDCVRHRLAMRGSVASEFIGDKPPKRSALLLEKPTEEPDRGCLVPPFPDQDIQDLPIPINGPKQIMLPSVDPNKGFIDKPLIAAWTRSLGASGVSALDVRRTLAWMAFSTNRWLQAHGGILHRKARVAHERDQVDEGLGIVQFRDRMNDNSGTGPAASRETEFNVSAKVRTSTANAESPECVSGQIARGKSDRSNGTPQGNQ